MQHLYPSSINISSSRQKVVREASIHDCSPLPPEISPKYFHYYLEDPTPLCYLDSTNFTFFSYPTCVSIFYQLCGTIGGLNLTYQKKEEKRKMEAFAKLIFFLSDIKLLTRYS